MLRHIGFVRRWLDKAEYEFGKDEAIKGELTLSLAKAEVQHAWETSLKKRKVVPLVRDLYEKPSVPGWRRIELILGIVAGLAIISLAGLAGNFGKRDAEPELPKAALLASRVSVGERLNPGENPAPEKPFQQVRGAEPVPNAGKVARQVTVAWNSYSNSQEGDEMREVPGTQGLQLTGSPVILEPAPVIPEPVNVEVPPEAPQPAENSIEISSETIVHANVDIIELVRVAEKALRED